jgi:hypothetical protein
MNVPSMNFHSGMRTARVHARMFSAVTSSASGVQRQAAASSAIASAIRPILPHAGPRPRRLRIAGSLFGRRRF